MESKEAMARLSQENLTAMTCFSRLLSANQPLFEAGEIDELARDCGLTREEALKTLLIAACDLRLDVPGSQRRLAERYFSPAIHAMDPVRYHQDPYCRQIHFPEKQQGNWRFTRLAYAPYQLFPCGHTRLLPDGRELPALGYFESAFSYPAVLEGGREWMTVTPNEIETMREGIAAAQGNIAVFGLGLGYFAFMASNKREVSSVSIIERDACLISLFQTHLLPQFPNRKKIRLIQADAFDYLSGPMTKAAYDFAFIDLWHDVSDGLPLYLRCRRLEQLSPDTEFSYWIEQDMLIFLRGLMMEDWLMGADRLDRFMNAADENLLSLAALHQIAPEITDADIVP